MKVDEIENIQNINSYSIENTISSNSFLYRDYVKKTYFIKNVNLFIKRLFDIVVSLIGIIFLIPVSIILFIVNFTFGDNGPVFYKHTRIGKNGKHFKMYKFRSMCIDADKKLETLLENNPSAKKEWEENQKLQNDPRVTKVGKFIRNTSIDEMPQFLNIFIGNMSFIGPRPVVDGEIEKFGEFKEILLTMKPGITGNWAANGRSDTTYDERVKMEIDYINNFSILTDIKILLKTIPSVIKKVGAR